ncbi:hypothetical protein HZS_2695, partial [Henneguya salminicola]
MLQSVDYIFENRLKAEISKYFRQILELPDEDILPLNADEKTSIHRFYLAFLRHENISVNPNISDEFGENLKSDLKNLLEGMKKEQVRKFIKSIEAQPHSSNTTNESIETNKNANNITEPIIFQNISYQKKSEIIKNVDFDVLDEKALDSLIDDLTVKNDEDQSQAIYKRKEIQDLNDDMSEISISDDIKKNLYTASGNHKINEELLDLLAKEGWKQYQKIEKNEAEPKSASAVEENINYLHWNFGNYEGKQILGSPGNPLKANGNVLFNKGSVTLLEESGSYLNGGDYKDYCISDPSKCMEGFSIQLTFKVNNIPMRAKDNQLFLIDTGSSSPDSRGFSIFLIQNETIGIHVANGDHNWCASKSFSKELLNKWISLIVIFNQSEGISIISNCKDILWAVPYGRCTPCLECHQTDMKTDITIGRPNNIKQDYITLPLILSDLEIFFYPLNHTKIFEKCGILDDPTHSAKKDKIYQTYRSVNKVYHNDPYLVGSRD